MFDNASDGVSPLATAVELAADEHGGGAVRTLEAKRKKCFHKKINENCRYSYDCSLPIDLDWYMAHVYSIEHVL